MTALMPEPTVFTPAATVADRCAEAWLRQATLRLRREVCWRWRQQGVAQPDPDTPPPVNAGERLQESLDLLRYWEAKQAFFRSDATAAYLTAKIEESPPPSDGSALQGSFSWVVKALELDDVAAFVLALALLARLDAAAGPVLAACQNDPARSEATLGLVQRLWDRPEKCLLLANPAHALWRYGLLQRLPASAAATTDWDAPLTVPPLLAETLLGLATEARLFKRLQGETETLPEAAGPLVDRLRAPAMGLRLMAIQGRRGSPYAPVVAALAAAAGRSAVGLTDGSLANADDLAPLLTLAWLNGVDLLLPGDIDHEHLLPRLAALRTLPLTLYLTASERLSSSALPQVLLLPVLSLPPLSYEGRVQRFKERLGGRSRGLEPAIVEAARRFRFEAETIDVVCAGLLAHQGSIGAQDLVAACRASSVLEPGELAQAVQPRFRPEELVLPPVQQRQFDDIERAMRSLATVHYAWGTGRVWNESGISVLFAGPSGVGKTMAAEVLSVKLDIPMFRINLSQVVNKYIGETEKNLERVFDAADASETLLFFDEADSLFGRRTEVRDAHDRYANLEVSYLLERMERFKGLAILATNRRNDLDDAFLRRLRYIVEFPMPETTQRRAIWQQVIPEGLDASELDLDFLAERFQLSGGNIRSAMFNACLQIASRPASKDGPRLTMEEVVIAVKREYEKLQRTVSQEQFGPYSQLVQAVSRD
jgi:hypothetical protein